MDELLLCPFSGEAIFLSQVSHWQSALLVTVPRALGVTLQGCRGEAMGVFSFPLPWLFSACSCHSDDTRVTAAHALSYILLQDS